MVLNRHKQNECTDPVVAEYKIVFCSESAETSYLFQSSPNASIASLPSNSKIKYKPKSKLFEFNLPLDTQHETFNVDRAEDFLAEDSLSSKKSSPYLNSIVVGKKGLESLLVEGSPLVRTETTDLDDDADNRLFLTYFVSEYDADNQSINLIKVKNDHILGLKQNLSYLEKSKISEAERSRKNETIAATPALKQIQTQFKKKESDEQTAARLSSYKHLKRLIDEEPWKYVPFHKE